MTKTQFPIESAKPEISWAVKGIFIKETEKAVCIEIEGRSKWGGRDKNVWLPKSQITEIEFPEAAGTDWKKYTIPAWLYAKLMQEVPDGYWAIHAPDCNCTGCAPKGTYVWLRCGFKPYVVTREAFDNYNSNHPEKPLVDDDIRRLASINS